ncbi:MAG: enoyl-CoA hydratase-related protein [Prolixibacteraceae bacterium]|jgi:methylglutaconyl-CoA hydratase|nr:enoyl-CoA hydratase-related protein [Prolixibacteraceae bacterium]
MDNYQTIRTELNGANLTLWLTRPQVHNALDPLMIREISQLFSLVEKIPDIRVVIIRGQGKSFCSGADLQWMKNAFMLSDEENLKECEELSVMFRMIFLSSKVVLGVVHGNVFGGGNGLVAVCDLAVGLSNARFSLSETKIGMVAATITPYLLQRMRISDLKELIFSARNFDGDEAVKYGLLDHSFSSIATLDHYLNNFLVQVEENGRGAIEASKQLINRLTLQSMAKTMEQIPQILAQTRISPEAREGFSAFLGKRKPNW